MYYSGRVSTNTVGYSVFEVISLLLAVLLVGIMYLLLLALVSITSFTISLGFLIWFTLYFIEVIGFLLHLFSVISTLVIGLVFVLLCLTKLIISYIWV